MTDVKTCANPACSCIPQEKEKYCSAHCEGMGDKVEVLCGCGHASCQGAVSEPEFFQPHVAVIKEETLDPEIGTI